MKTVAIDLRELTARRLRTALKTPGDKQCFYSTPCIIGTLIERGNRDDLDYAEIDETTVEKLVAAGYLSIPDNQLEAACALQNAYDTGNKDLLRELAKPWIAANKDTPHDRDT